MRTLCTFLALAALALACSSSSGSIGAPCSSAGQCGASDYCSTAGVCARYCQSHDDCGCAPGTTNDDLAAGKCHVACLATSASQAVCVKTCATSADCSGTTGCNPVVNGAQALGYSACY